MKLAAEAKASALAWYFGLRGLDRVLFGGDTADVSRRNTKGKTHRHYLNNKLINKRKWQNQNLRQKKSK